jgi:AcrR family transcriptional regulator
MAKRTFTPGPRDERGVLSARILASAREQFAETGWAGTTIRAVARTADVDPALIYHYFGSKENLLAAATTPPQRFLDSVASAWQAPLPELGRELLKNMLAAWADPEIGPVLRSIVQTAAHEPKTREKLSGVVEGSLMGVAELGGDPDDRRLRSGLVATQMIGFALMRYVWKIEPIASMSEEQVLATVAPNVQRYIEGDLWP